MTPSWQCMLLGNTKIVNSSEVVFSFVRVQYSTVQCGTYHDVCGSLQLPYDGFEALRAEHDSVYCSFNRMDYRGSEGKGRGGKGEK